MYMYVTCVYVCVSWVTTFYISVRFMIYLYIYVTYVYVCNMCVCMCQMGDNVSKDATNAMGGACAQIRGGGAGGGARIRGERVTGAFDGS